MNPPPLRVFPTERFQPSRGPRGRGRGRSAQRGGAETDSAPAPPKAARPRPGDPVSRVYELPAVPT